MFASLVADRRLRRAAVVAQAMKRKGGDYLGIGWRTGGG